MRVTALLLLPFFAGCADTSAIPTAPSTQAPPTAAAAPPTLRPPFYRVSIYPHTHTTDHLFPQPALDNPRPSIVWSGSVAVLPIGAQHVVPTSIRLSCGGGARTTGGGTFEPGLLGTLGHSCRWFERGTYEITAVADGPDGFGARDTLIVTLR